MNPSVFIEASSTVTLDDAPIAPAWILEGMPRARYKELARSDDGTSYVVVWDCTAGRFNWHYNRDESVVVTAGEAFITDAGRERRIAPGDVVFFPAGASALWRVPDYVRKVAFLRHTMPRPAGYGLRAWNLLLRKLKGGDGGL